jgi:hypothetical protein
VKNKNIFDLQWKPNYLLWWLLYQIIFIIATGRIIVFFIRLKEEKYGILSYIRNFVTRTIVRFFVTTFLLFVILLIYFWPNMISLFVHLKKVKNKKKTATVGVNGDANVNVSTFGNVQMLQLEVPRNSSIESQDRREPKIFILQV